jgi:hypothetical protein
MNTVNSGTGSGIIETWPDESREAAQLVIDAYGEPHETTDSLLIWHRVGQWKRIVASKTFYQHQFPAPHIDCVESFVDYRVPVAKFTALAEFDGSVVVERTAGKPMGSTISQVERAEALADASRDRARRAIEQAAVAARTSAEVHDSAAVLHDRSADLGLGDAETHRRRATEHRQQAELDRAEALKDERMAND